jgi:hypothetical protein
MLRHDKGGKSGRITTDFDLEVAGGVAGIEWADQRQDGIENCLAPVEPWKIQVQFPAGGSEVEDAIFRESRRERIRVTMVEAKGVAMKGVGDFVTVSGELREVGAHRAESRQTARGSKGRSGIAPRINNPPAFLVTSVAALT